MPRSRRQRRVSRPVRLLAAPEITGEPTSGRSTASCLLLRQRRRRCRRPAQRRPPRAQVAGDGRRLRYGRTCVYELSARRLVQHGRAPRQCERARARATGAAQLPGEPNSERCRSVPRAAAAKANGGDATALRDYLAAVARRPPPHCARWRRRASAPSFAAQLFCTVATRRGCCLRPPLPRCPPLRAGAAGTPLPPCVPAGAYYAPRAPPPARYFRTPRLSVASPSPCCAPLPLHAAGSPLVARRQARPCALVDRPLALVRYRYTRGPHPQRQQAALAARGRRLRWATRRTTVRGGWRRC